MVPRKFRVEDSEGARDEESEMSGSFLFLVVPESDQKRRLLVT